MKFRTFDENDRNRGFADVETSDRFPGYIGDANVAVYYPGNPLIPSDGAIVRGALVIIDLSVATVYLENGPEDENPSPHSSGFDTGFYLAFADGTTLSPTTAKLLFENLSDPIDGRVLVGLGFERF